jgi:hypothetical protein
MSKESDTLPEGMIGSFEITKKGQQKQKSMLNKNN